MQATYVYYRSDDILTCFASTFSRTSVGLALSKFLLNKNTENDEFHFKFKTTENYFTNTLTIRLKWNRGFMLEARLIKVI